MRNVTTIQTEKRALKLLKEIKEHPRQTYSELIMHMAEVFKKAKKEDEYDRFLHKIQQEKMKELWDNRFDKEWENV